MRSAWRQRVSCGPGSKGDRVYDWALAGAGPGHDLLIRRSASSGELAFYRCWAPSGAALADLVRAAGARWAVEECFAAAENETALDHYQVRTHTAWYRHVTLAMCAHAWLAVTASASRPPPAGPCGQGGPATVTRRSGAPSTRRQPSRPAADHPPATSSELTCLTVNEIRRLHAIFPWPAHSALHHLRWSAWRRRHQARARHCHYQRRQPRGSSPADPLRRR
jgi:hypothetical protein